MDRRPSVNYVDSTSEIRRSTAAVYHNDRQALSAARFRRADLLATADTCSVQILVQSVICF